MDFLLLDGEQDVMLEEALAFIDTWEKDGENGTTTDHSTDSDYSSYSPVLSPLQLHSEESSQKRAVASRNDSDFDDHQQSQHAVGTQVMQRQPPQTQQQVSRASPKTAAQRAVARYRKRMKVEAIELREQVARLTAKLEQLQTSDTRKAARRVMEKQVRTSASASFEFGHVALELHKRRQSESLNSSLKHALKNQVELVESIGGLFQREMMMQV